MTAGSTLDVAHRDAELGGVPDALEEVGRLEHGLGGDAADVQAGAADPAGPSSTSATFRPS